MNTYGIAVLLLVVGLVGGFFLGNTDFSESTHTMDMSQETASHGGGHAAMIEVPHGENAPTIALEVFKDPKSGWNAHITTSNFTFSPERVSTEHIFGEGHAHIYVDGVKINRMYGDWYHLGELAVGEHEVRVELNANDHAIYAVDGKKVEDIVTVVVEKKKEVDRAHAQTHTLTISNRSLDPEIITVTQDESVIFTVSTDEMGEFHISGYEIEKDMDVQGTVEIAFVADKAGRYNFELHPKMEMMEGESHGEQGHGESEEDIVIGAFVVEPK